MRAERAPKEKMSIKKRSRAAEPPARVCYRVLSAPHPRRTASAPCRTRSAPHPLCPAPHPLCSAPALPRTATALRTALTPPQPPRSLRSLVHRRSTLRRGLAHSVYSSLARSALARGQRGARLSVVRTATVSVVSVENCNRFGCDCGELATVSVVDGGIVTPRRVRPPPSPAAVRVLGRPARRTAQPRGPA